MNAQPIEHKCVLQILLYIFLATTAVVLTTWVSEDQQVLCIANRSQVAAEVCHASKYTSNHGQEILDMGPIDEIDQESFDELKEFS